MKTFREYVREKYSGRANDKSDNPFSLVVYDILNDRTFPDQENDGLMVRSYIRDRAGIDKDQDMIDAFEDLWILYKADAGQYVNPALAG